MTVRTILTVIAILILSLFAASTVSAHSTIPRVEINTERQIPGGVVDIRGVSFGMEDTIDVTLIGANVEISLVELISDPEGEFKYTAVLPADLVAGTYYFRAVTSHHWVISPPLTVWGNAVSEGGGQGPRDDDDGLLAPMPTYAPGVVPGGTSSAPIASPEPAQVPPASSGWSANILMLIGLMVIVALALLALRKKRLA